MKEASRRLFFALWPTAAEQARMVEAARAPLAASGGLVTSEGNLHVTLAFLGSVAERRVEEVVAIARRVAAAGVVTPPLQFSFERLEYWKKAQVLCVVPTDAEANAGAATNAVAARGTLRDATYAASVLAAALKTGLDAAGFTPDLKPFQPHVTLARKVETVPSPRELSPVRWSFEDYALVESRTDARGPTYQALHRFAL